MPILLAIFFSALGGAGAFYAYSEYQKSNEPAKPVTQIPNTGPPAEPETAKQPDEKAPPARTDKSEKSAEAPRSQPGAARPKRGGPKVSGGMKLPPIAQKTKLFEKPAATLALDHDVKAVKQVMVGGAEGPVVLVMRRTFDGLGGQGMRDTIDRYALNTLRRIDQTEVPADAVKSYPRVGDIGPGGDRYAFEHPLGKLSVVQLGTKTVLVDGLDLADKADAKAAAHPGIAAIYFLTDEKVAVVAKNGVVESWDIAARKKIGASDPIPGAVELVDRRTLAVHRDRDPDRSQIFAYAGGAVYSVAPGGKPRLALTLPHGPTEGLALAADGGANRIALAYRATEPGEHFRFLHARVGDPKPGADEPLDAEVGEPIQAEWTRPETFSILTDKGQGFAYDADTNQLIAGFRTSAPTLAVMDGTRHWFLLPDTKDPKRAVFVNVTIPPEDYSPSLTGAKWKPYALAVGVDGLAK